MFRMLFTAIFVTLAFSVINHLIYKKWKICESVIMFILIIIAFMSFSSLHAVSRNAALEQAIILEKVVIKDTISPETFKDYYTKMNFHIKEGDYWIENVKKICWFMPEMSPRKRAEEFVVAFFATIAVAEPRLKLITAFLTMASEYSLDCMDEWQQMSQALLWAEYHYDMARFYGHMIDNAKIK